MPGFPFPPAGPLDLGSPPSQVIWVAKTSPSPLSPSLRSCLARRYPAATSTSLPSAQVALTDGPGGPGLGRHLLVPSRAGRRGDLSGFPCFPTIACPGSLPRWIPCRTAARHTVCCLPEPLALSALPQPQRRPFSGPTTAACDLVFPLLCTTGRPVARRFPSALPAGFGRAGLSALTDSRGEAVAGFLVCSTS